MNRNPYDLEFIQKQQREVATVARRALIGEIGLIAASRQLSRLAHDVVRDWVDDPDFVVFGALDSETDHLPLEDQRAAWDPAAFDKKQRHVQRMEAAYREDALAACARLVDRFGGV